MSITEVTNHTELGLKRLLEQYKKSNNLKYLITSFTDQLQEIESMLFDLKNNRSINTAEGVQLDLIGSIVGIDRQPNESDADYKVRIETRIIINLSSGEPERVIDVFYRYIEPTLIILNELYPAAVSLSSDVDVTDQDYLNLIYDQLETVLAAGVRLDYIGYFDTDVAFTLDSSVNGLGLGDTTDLNIGGELGKLLEYTGLEFTMGTVDDDEETSELGGFGTIINPLIGGRFI